MRVILIAVYGGIGSVLFLVGLIGNSLIIAFFGYKVKKKTLYDVFILSLAISDFTGTVLCSVSLFLFFIYPIHSLCLTLQGLVHMFLGISAFLVVGMSYERSRGITKPIHFRKPKKKHVVIYFAFVCVVWALYGLGLHASMRDDHPYCDTFITNENHYYFLSLIFTKSIIPLIAMWFFYFKTKISLRQHQQHLQNIVTCNRNIAVLKT